MPPAIRVKAIPVTKGLDRTMKWAKKYGVEMAFGVDAFGPPERLFTQDRAFAARLKWFTPAELLRQATSINADLFSMSGPRNPHQDGPLEVITESAYADMIIVDDNPLRDIRVLKDYEKNFMIIMKDGVIYRNTL
jgi:imidazolonepropionase-like amidohydrolase